MNYTLRNMILLGVVFAASSCADNSLEEEPRDENFPLQLVLDAEEGGDLPDSEDYGLEVKFADFLGELPDAEVSVDFTIAELTGSMQGVVRVDKVIYEKEIDDEEVEVELNFTSSNDGLTGTIQLNDPTTGELPASFEVIFVLPGIDETEGNFTFELSNLQAGNANIILGMPRVFEYEVLDHELAGTWVLELNEEEFESFREVFGPLSEEINDLDFAEVDGAVAVEAEFEFEEFNLTLTYTTLAGDEIEIEVEAEYDFDDEEKELTLEGSYVILGDDGEIEDELDFEIAATYNITEGQLTIQFESVIDEDNFAEGEELFFSEDGLPFTFDYD